MKIVIDIKSSSKTQSFNKNDVILYDGKQWYVTTMESLCDNLEKKYNETISKLEKTIYRLEKNYADFLLSYNEQNAKLLPIIEKLLGEDEELWKEKSLFY